MIPHSFPEAEIWENFRKLYSGNKILRDGSDVVLIRSFSSGRVTRPDRHGNSLLLTKKELRCKMFLHLTPLSSGSWTDQQFCNQTLRWHFIPWKICPQGLMHWLECSREQFPDTNLQTNPCTRSFPCHHLRPGIRGQEGTSRTGMVISLKCCFLFSSQKSWRKLKVKFWEETNCLLSFCWLN